MLAEHQELFEKLCNTYDVVVVSGSKESVIREDIPKPKTGYFVLAQSGNHAEDKDGSLLWQESFTDTQKNMILEFIKEIHDEVRLSVTNEHDLVEDRGSQVSYSMIGHNEDRAKKKAFDPGAKKRLEILAVHTAQRNTLKEAGVEVMPGGTTCFDFYMAGKHKGFNITRLIERYGWRKEECVYVGDALFPGGNDEAVLGVIPIHAVSGPDETFAYVGGILAQL